MGESTVSTSEGKKYIILFGQPNKKKIIPTKQSEVLLKSLQQSSEVEKKDSNYEIFEDTIEYQFDPERDLEPENKTIYTNFIRGLKKIFVMFTPGKKRQKSQGRKG
ncbi:hypothetical protein [Candidatus Uabimicrobium sp. HlEnr_7]|uniref:hypothetical protein n=1 Tax=Candidatus Uabimicrobium helgolandensis TaxID=3095367 RepID=UPI00355600A8